MAVSTHRIKGREKSDRERDFRVTVSLNGITVVDVFRGYDNQCAKRFECWLKKEVVIEWDYNIKRGGVVCNRKNEVLGRLSVSEYIAYGHSHTINNQLSVVRIFEQNSSYKLVNAIDTSVSFKKEVVISIKLLSGQKRMLVRKYVSLVDDVDCIDKKRAIKSCVNSANNWVKTGGFKKEVPRFCI